MLHNNSGVLMFVFQALAHFGVVSEAPPPKDPTYPRVVRPLYEDRRMGTRQEQQRVSLMPRDPYGLDLVMINN